MASPSGNTATLERVELLWDSKRNVHRVVTARQKTGTDVSVVIPGDVAEEVIAAMELNESKQYIFWNTGTGTERTAVTNWQTDLHEIFVAAKIPDGHSHQLRDTFAVDLLKRGMPMEELSKLLGHTTLRTTEKHYAAWVQSRQDRLDAMT